MYNQYFDLNDCPFGLTPNSKYFYATRPHKHLIEHLAIGFEQRDGVLVLTGEKGIGKTSSVFHMLEDVDRYDNVFAYVQTPPENTSNLLYEILLGFKVQVPDRTPKEMFSLFQQFVLKQAKSGKKILIIIDNAEQLSQKCLDFVRVLSSLKSKEDGLLQILLAGTHELDVLLASNENDALSDQVSMTCHMHPLELSDTKEYIEHRLNLAGWSGEPDITESALSAIHDRTKGIPYEINHFCNLVLLFTRLRKARIIDSQIVSSLTPAVIAELEELEASQETEQTSVEHSPLDLHLKGYDMDNVDFARSKSASLGFFSKKLATAAAVCLVASLSFFFYDKLPLGFATNPTQNSHTAATSHTQSENDNQHDALVTAKYVLDEMPNRLVTRSRAGVEVSEIQLLDIQQLQHRSTESRLPQENVQTSGDNRRHSEDTTHSANSSSSPLNNLYVDALTD